MAVPKTSAARVRRRFPVLRYARPHSSAPNMLPGKAMRLPKLMRFRSKLEVKAPANPYQGPRNTANRMFTICCTGAHLLPNTGKERVLPATATAHRRAATASFFT